MDGFPSVLVKVAAYGGPIVMAICAAVWLIQHGLLSFNLNIGKPSDASKSSDEPPLDQRPRLPAAGDGQSGTRQNTPARPRTRGKTTPGTDGRQ